MIDWVPNHTSDQHPWFQASRSSRDDPKRDWYVWRDRPNDWTSQFKAVGPSWTFDEPTGQWYLHSFMREQPDLNWDNPEVEAAMHDVIRFWMDRGVDGLRLDAIHKIAKDPLLRDHAGAPRRHDEDWETIHERLRGIRRVVDEYEDRMVVGEVALQDLHRIVGYLESGDQLHLAHNFVFVDLPWEAEAFGTSIDDFEALADRTAWPAWFLENHDKPRAGVAASAPGRRAPPPSCSTRCAARRSSTRARSSGCPTRRSRPTGWSTSTAATPCARRCRGSPGRARASPTASRGCPVDDALNAREQAGDPRSQLSLFRRLAALRRELPALQSGTQRTRRGRAGRARLAARRADPRGGQLRRRAAAARARGGRCSLSSDPDGTGERPRAARGRHPEAR